MQYGKDPFTEDQILFRYIAFILKFTEKQYPQQHFVIVQNNHIAETGFIPVNDGFIHKELRRSRYNVEEKQLYIY
ncbi:hypothetical protein AHW80_20220 [Salmonella enterica subsp. enterica]|nr:hypothetical protein [Salmonella enterica subsp. enterica]ECE7087710.1 hypothetical protein [Salmonella enterica subsp. enterica]